jgi:hypothetical protein
MNVKELIAYLEDCDPELPVYVKANDTDYDYQMLTVGEIESDYVYDMDDEDSIEVKAIILGVVS